MWLACPAHVLRLIAGWERIHLESRWGCPSVLLAEVHLLRSPGRISFHPFPADVEALPITFLFALLCFLPHQVII